uniref:hypothetical protein n=1 Tax=Rhodococcus hoagii TaxID=43767 RepID=UPI001C93118C
DDWEVAVEVEVVEVVVVGVEVEGMRGVVVVEVGMGGVREGGGVWGEVCWEWRGRRWRMGGSWGEWGGR